MVITEEKHSATATLHTDCIDCESSIVKFILPQPKPTGKIKVFSVFSTITIELPASSLRLDYFWKIAILVDQPFVVNK